MRLKLVSFILTSDLSEQRSFWSFILWYVDSFFSLPKYGFYDETHTTFAVFTLALVKNLSQRVVERNIFLGCLIKPHTHGIFFSTTVGNHC